MTLPDRTLCWVEGPPWDRGCDPVRGVELDGDRLKAYGEVVDEGRDERGHYAVVVLARKGSDEG